jgi:alpha-L-fucosidase 2
LLGRDRDYGQVIGDLRSRLYLPQVSPKTGWLEEWMTPDNLGDPQHRHLSPLFGLFPGDRITVEDSPGSLVDGARALLTVRGMQSFGWGCAWRSLCWSRLKDAEKAYQLVTTNLAPSIHNSNGTAPNLFDIYSFGSSASTFQIDANFGTPSAMVEMLLYSRPGLIELLPALPAAWAASGEVTGIGARGGFVVDLQWQDGRVTRARIRSVGGRRTSLRMGRRTRDVTLRPGQSVTLRG